MPKLQFLYVSATTRATDPSLTSPTKMLLTKLLLLPMAVASSVTLYVSSVPASDNTAIIPSPIPLAQIEYDADQSVGTLSSYTPPTGSYASDHLLRVGLQDTGSGAWRGIVTSAASFADEYHKKFIIHVDEKGEPFHVGFGTSVKRAGDDVEVEIVKRSPGPKAVLNKPIVLNAEGKIDSIEPEKSFLQKCVAVVILVIVRSVLTDLQILVGHRAVLGRSAGCRWRRWQIDDRPWKMKQIIKAASRGRRSTACVQISICSDALVSAEHVEQGPRFWRRQSVDTPVDRRNKQTHEPKRIVIMWLAVHTV